MYVYCPCITSARSLPPELGGPGGCCCLFFGMCSSWKLGPPWGSQGFFSLGLQGVTLSCQSRGNTIYELHVLGQVCGHANTSTCICARMYMHFMYLFLLTSSCCYAMDVCNCCMQVLYARMDTMASRFEQGGCVHIPATCSVGFYKLSMHASWGFVTHGSRFFHTWSGCTCSTHVSHCAFHAWHHFTW